MAKEKKVIRDFEVDDKDYQLIEPNAQVVREAKLKYSIQFTRGVRNKLYVRKSLEKQLKESDPEFFKDYEERRRELLAQMITAEQELNDVTDPDRLDIVAQMLTIYRAQLLEEDQLMSSLYENTADHLAEEERISYLAYGMVRDKNGSPLKETYEEFMNDLEPSLFEYCKYEVLCWQYQLDPNWQENLPEVKASKKAQDIKEEQEKEEKVEESEKTTVEKPVKKPVKKQVRKKTTKAKAKKAPAKTRTTKKKNNKTTNAE